MPTPNSTQPTARKNPASGRSKLPQAMQMMAIMRIAVALLPRNRTSMRMPRPARSAAPTTSTATSRTRTARPAHRGRAPRTMTAMRPAPTASRSATGSRILPSSETWFVRRATYPSTQSVAATPANSSIPAISVPSCTIRRHEHRDQQDAQERHEVRDGQDGRRRRLSASGAVHRSGRPDSNRRPSVPQTDALTKLRHGPMAPSVSAGACVGACALTRPRGASGGEAGTAC